MTDKQAQWFAELIEEISEVRRAAKSLKDEILKNARHDYVVTRTFCYGVYDFLRHLFAKQEDA